MSSSGYAHPQDQSCGDVSLSAGSLFAGIGGICLGFGRAGIKTKWAIESDPNSVLTYGANIPGVKVVATDGQPADIRDVSVSTHQLSPVDVLHAGFPCQSFSAAGGKRGFEDDRGKLFFEVVRLLHEFGENRPAVLVLENSPHLRVGEGGSWFIEIIREIKKAGYWFRESNCAELDAYSLTHLPQKRNRLFMVAFSTKAFRNGKFAFPSSVVPCSKDLRRYIAFEDEIDDDSYYLNESNRYHKMITDDFSDPYSIYQLRKYLVRVKEPGVCPTLTANMGLGGHNVPFIFDKRGLRKLTEYECLRLQGFPDTFEFPEDVPRARRYVQIGNSVVPLVAEALAERIVRKFEEVQER